VSPVKNIPDNPVLFKGGFVGLLYDFSYSTVVIDEKIRSKKEFLGY
jgi:hypothetical protein